jgi:hypothetical protein
VPVPDAQLSVLPALVAAGPTTAEIETTFAGGNVNVNCRATGSLPAGDVKVRFRDTVPFAAAVPEDKTNESVCPKEAWVVTKSAKSDAIQPELNQRLFILLLSMDKVLLPYPCPDSTNTFIAHPILKKVNYLGRLRLAGAAQSATGDI